MNRADIAKEEFIALRAEILQSISIQHRITTGGYAVTGAIAGYILSSSQITLTALAVLPLILFAMSCLWAVECNRMVRAGVYIADRLWPELSVAADSIGYEGWEKWIRQPNGFPAQFTDRQDRLQQIVVMVIPLVLTLASDIVELTYAWTDSMTRYGLMLWLFLGAVAWWWLQRRVRRIANLGYFRPG